LTQDLRAAVLDVMAEAYAGVRSGAGPEALQRLPRPLDVGQRCAPGWLALYLPTEPLRPRGRGQRLCIGRHYAMGRRDSACMQVAAV